MDRVIGMTASTSNDNPNNKGGENDIILHFHEYYKRMGWDKICPFNPHGKLGYMYAIFKDKNCVDPTIRNQKYKKSRPITPYCKHPMKNLLHYVARAWMFIIKQLKGSHFAIHSTQQFKEDHFRFGRIELSPCSDCYCYSARHG